MKKGERNKEAQKGASGLAKWLLKGLFFIFLMVLGFVMWRGIDLFSSPLEKFSKALSQLTHSEVRVEGESLLLENEEIAELALMNQTSISIIKYKTRWMGSDNLLILKGKFQVKTGYDLKEFSSLQFLAGQSFPEKLPPVKILSLELKDYEVYHSENGMLNKLTPKDQERALKQLLKQARKDVEESDLFLQTERLFRNRMGDLINF